MGRFKKNSCAMYVHVLLMPLWACYQADVIRCDNELVRMPQCNGAAAATGLARTTERLSFRCRSPGGSSLDPALAGAPAQHSAKVL